MAPIPLYANSPITAAKPDGVTPKTTSGTDQTTKAPTATSTYTPTTSYPAAQPGALPSLPAATTPALAQPTSTLQPTPTTSWGNAGPAPPQPGSVPVSGIPPPPKVGEKYCPPTQAPVTTSTMPYPHQMSIPTPVTPHTQQQATSTATTTVASPLPYGAQIPYATTVVGGGGGQKLAHPAGYQQNVNASELDKYQRMATSQREADDDEEGVWGTAKKLAQQTGERLAAVENEVWKRINKE